MNLFSRFGGSRLRHVLFLFILVCLSRSLLNLVFFSYYGPHAVKNVELWLYYGVASGSHVTDSGALDFTVQLLRLLGFLLNDDLLPYSIVGLGVFSAFVSGVLVYLLVERISGGREARLASFAYVFLAQVLSLNVAGFTHDLVQTPIMLGVCLFVLEAWDSRGRRRLSCFFLALALLTVGFFVHAGILAVVGVLGIYAGFRLTGGDDRRFLFFLAFLFVFIVFFSICVLPRILDFTLGSIAQGSSGSADVEGLSLGSFFLRYSVLAFILPFGVAVALRRREGLGLGFLLVGAMVSLYLDRGARIMDVGFALVCVKALSDRRLLKRFFPASLLLSLPLFFSGIEVLQAALIFFGVLVFSLVLFKSRSFEEGSVVVFGVVGFLIVFSGFFLHENVVVSEAEYRVFSGLGDGGRVLASWDRGFMVEALSGRSVVSSPADVNFPVHEAFWMPEAQAWNYLRGFRVDTIVFPSDSFDYEVVGEVPFYVRHGGLVLKTDSAPPPDLSEDILAYGLRYGTVNKSFFRLVDSVVDEVSGGIFSVYRLADGVHLANPVAVLAKNHEDRVLEGVLEFEYMGYESDEFFWRGDGRVLPDLLRLEPACIVSSGLWITAVFFVLCLALVLQPGLFGRFSSHVPSNVNLAVLSFLIFLVFVVLSMNYGGGCSGDCGVEPVPYDIVSVRSFNVSLEPGGERILDFSLGPGVKIADCSARFVDEGFGFSGSVLAENGCGGDAELTVLLVDETASEYSGSPVFEEQRVYLISAGETRLVEYGFGRRYPHHDYSAAFGKPSCLDTWGNESMQGRVRGLDVVYASCPLWKPMAEYKRMN